MTPTSVKRRHDAPEEFRVKKEGCKHLLNKGLDLIVDNFHLLCYIHC